MIFSISEDISRTSKTAMRPRSPVVHVGVRTGSYTLFGIGKRYFSGSVESCFSIAVRLDAESSVSFAPSGQKVRTNLCAIERIRTGGIR